MANNATEMIEAIVANDNVTAEHGIFVIFFFFRLIYIDGLYVDAFRIFFVSRDLEFFFFFFLLLLFPYFLINFSIESKKSFLFDMSLPFWYIRFKTHRLTKQRTIVLLLSAFTCCFRFVFFPVCCLLCTNENFLPLSF